MRKHRIAFVGGLALVLAWLPACQVSAVRRAGASGACAKEELAGMQLQRQVAESIVRVVSEGGAGTGFAIKRPGRDLLIVTNYHVISRAAELDVMLPSGARLGKVEVVKIDIDRDLALLRAPALGQAVPGLTLATTHVALAEPVAAMGYPGVSGEREPSLTFEEGRVTSPSTELEGQTYIRTNANINPGNSGGPVINACAQVVGVVVAIHKQAERTGLVIPVSDLQALLKKYQEPRRVVDDELGARISSLEEAVRFRQGFEVTGMFTRKFLTETASTHFANNLLTLEARLTERIDAVLLAMKKSGEPYMVGDIEVLNYQALPKDERPTLMVKALSEDEMVEVRLLLMIKEEQIDLFTGMTLWLGRFAHSLFGQDPSFTLRRVVKSDEKSAEAMVTIESGGVQQFWLFHWTYEWGDWRIECFHCTSGCQGSS